MKDRGRQIGPVFNFMSFKQAVVQAKQVSSNFSLIVIEPMSSINFG